MTGTAAGFAVDFDAAVEVLVRSVNAGGDPARAMMRAYQSLAGVY